MPLPVSGLEVTLRLPSGADEVMLREAASEGTELALTLVQRLAAEDYDWTALPAPDLDALLIALRQIVAGDLLKTDMPCPVGDCGALMDVSFRLSEYLAHHTPRLARGLRATGEPGWYQKGDVTFRLPTVSDRLETSSAAELAQRCIRPERATSAQRRRAENAMAALAPSLSHEIDARCPECGTDVKFYFDVQRFVLRELRSRAYEVFEDVHLIASRYGWSEPEILALPRSRRTQYAELVRSERVLV